MPDKFAILVTVKLKPGMAARYRPNILKNAEAAVRDEPDCHQFQVMTAIDDPDTFFFLEVYSDEAALEHHRAQPHFVAYTESTREMVAERVVERCSVIDS